MPERYTIALFAKADRHADVGPMPQFVTSETPQRFPNLTEALRWYQKAASQDDPFAKQRLALQKLAED